MLRHHYALCGLLSAALEGPGQATVASLKRIILFFSTFVTTRSLPGCKCVRAGGGLPSAARRPVSFLLAGALPRLLPGGAPLPVRPFVSPRRPRELCGGGGRSVRAAWREGGRAPLRPG